MRTHVVTGAASGIGKATAELLRSQGHKVIGVDLRGSDIDVDLATVEGRNSLAEKVADASGGVIDSIIAVAGVALPSSTTVKVNYFGAVATLENLRPLLAKSSAPRAAVVASFAALQANDADLVSHLLAGDEEAAVARADELVKPEQAGLIYASSKRAIAEWVRTTAITDEWAAAGIPLNGVGPGVILTPMTAPMMETEEGRAALLQVVPMPLNGPAQPEKVAEVLAFLTDEANTHITAQIIFIDGGADGILRGPHIFDPAW
ncbi:SDR family oxidoreductase [Homoserinibacter sp. GY 40078]|uniref:SDR family oxidoreductase n=1 Tax=Homoserinibacter sp. GY 40078 TaxID=2603275 RepID=UPI0011CB6FA9|nr:SDR family oxidoreductase [Homoserinibacter sp. GY 40078]TXK19381.1 SDR family oxidoreductase [Homoserinibacter sp. GY 40078]